MSDPLLDKTIDVLEMISLYSFLGALVLGGIVLIRKAVVKRRAKDSAGSV